MGAGQRQAVPLTGLASGGAWVDIGAQALVLTPQLSPHQGDRGALLARARGGCCSVGSGHHSSCRVGPCGLRQLSSSCGHTSLFPVLVASGCHCWEGLLVPQFSLDQSSPHLVPVGMPALPWFCTTGFGGLLTGERLAAPGSSSLASDVCRTIGILGAHMRPPPL